MKTGRLSHIFCEVFVKWIDLYSAYDVPYNLPHAMYAIWFKNNWLLEFWCMYPYYVVKKKYSHTVK
jgi:hypothetical protein